MDKGRYKERSTNRAAPAKRKGVVMKKRTRHYSDEELQFDYKNFRHLERFINERGRITPRRITGLTAQQQRRLVCEVKRARILAFLPFTVTHSVTAEES